MNGLELLFSESARKKLAKVLTNKVMQDYQKDNININIMLTEK